MSTRARLAPLAAFALGCASAGGGNDLPPVQVFASTEELPCEYEVVETVSGTRSGSVADYERIRGDVLGRAGADVGADAVIEPRVRVEVAGGFPGRRDAPPLLIFTGEAIRFIPGTCRTAE